MFPTVLGLDAKQPFEETMRHTEHANGVMTDEDALANPTAKDYARQQFKDKEEPIPKPLAKILPGVQPLACADTPLLNSDAADPSALLESCADWTEERCKT